jgi:photosystem I subunit 11
MRFSDFWLLKNQILPADPDEAAIADDRSEDPDFRETMKGNIPLKIPGPSGWWDAGVWIKWRGPERFAGDQVQTAVRDSVFAKQFLSNLAFYRMGLKPWQRGFEIGIAHGYFIIGPFVSLGPLRNTPEAATIGLLSGVAVIMTASVGGLLFGTTIRPTIFDRPGDKPAEGFQEMISWHAIGGTGGAAFAHLLLTLYAL